MTLPPLLTLSEVQARLGLIFPAAFPDRGILVGIMAARVVFVSLYGGFLTGEKRFFRPSTITNFTDDQAAMATDEERADWVARCHKQGFKPKGTIWYANNSREPVRDDLIRNRFIPLAIISKLEGYAPTHPAPIYSMAPAFAALFDPVLTDQALVTAIEAWRKANLNPLTMRRMALLASGVKAKSGSMDVMLPTTGKMLRLTAGEASVITKDVCEVLATKMFSEPVVVHVSLSDQKSFPELLGAANALGLEFDPSLELPDVVFVDVGQEPLCLVFVEVVHSDGPITELRAQALLKIAKSAGIEAEHVMLITAFEDRSADAFRKRFSELAVKSGVWFRSEPDMLMHLSQMRKRGD